MQVSVGYQWQHVTVNFVSRNGKIACKVEQLYARQVFQLLNYTIRWRLLLRLSSKSCFGKFSDQFRKRCFIGSLFGEHTRAREQCFKESCRCYRAQAVFGDWLYSIVDFGVGVRFTEKYVLVNVLSLGKAFLCSSLWTISQIYINIIIISLLGIIFETVL